MEFSYQRRNWRQKTDVRFSLVAELMATEFGISVIEDEGTSDGYYDKLFFGWEKLAGQGVTE